MAKSYKLSGTDNYIDASGVVYNKKELPTYLDKVDGIADGANKTITANNLTTTAAGSVLDARQGKILYDKINGTVLYENFSGNTGTITLQENVNNYTYIDITLTRKDIADYAVQRFHKPNGRTITIMGTFTDATNLYAYSKVMTVLNNTFTLVRSNLLFANSAVSFSTDNNFAIVKVVGYK